MSHRYTGVLLNYSKGRVILFCVMMCWKIAFLAACSAAENVLLHVHIVCSSVM